MSAAPGLGRAWPLARGGPGPVAGTPEPPPGMGARPPRRRPPTTGGRPGRSSRGQQRHRPPAAAEEGHPGPLDATWRRPPPRGRREASPRRGERGRWDGDTEPSELRRTKAAGCLRRSSRGAPGPRSIDMRPSDRRGPGRIPGAAMCVRSVDDQCVLQFTLVLAAGCVLHRRTSRVIHR